jgi:aminopeptidase N
LELTFLLAHDSDEFNRWEAGHNLATRTIIRLIEERHSGKPWALPATVSAAFAQAMSNPELDPALLNQLFTLPDENYLAEQMAIVDVDGIHEARIFMRRALAETLRDQLLTRYNINQEITSDYAIDAATTGRRSLKNRCLDYLMQLNDPDLRQLCLTQFYSAANMTDALSALGMLANCECPERLAALAAFHERWQHEPLVMDKWFMLQATSQLPNALAEVKALVKHPAFTMKNPNKVRSLIGAFCHANPVRFHAIDGSGYTFLTAQVERLNAINPQIAARLVGAFTRWRRYDAQRQALMQTQLERILQIPDLSPDVYEITAKSLAAKGT